jgi:hypothetical protein
MIILLSSLLCSIFRIDTINWIEDPVIASKTPNRSAINLGVEENNKFIYELVEKSEDFESVIPQMRDLVNATFFMQFINMTQHTDPLTVEILGLINVTIVEPLEFYFNTYYLLNFSGFLLTFSEALFHLRQPEVLGISEWAQEDLDFTGLALSKIINGTSTLPGLVAEHEMGTGVLEYLELYDRAVEDPVLKQNITEGYNATWYQLTKLTQYYRNYFIQDGGGVDKLEPFAEDFTPQLAYMQVMEEYFCNNNDVGDFYCLQIDRIVVENKGWNITILTWDYTSHLEVFKDDEADSIRKLSIFSNATEMGEEVSVLDLLVLKQDFIPLNVGEYLNSMKWNEIVERNENSISELVYSESPEDYPFDFINISVSTTYNADGVMQSIRWYAKVEVTSKYWQPITIYELVLHEEEQVNLIENNGNRNGITLVITRLIIVGILLSVFVVGFGLILKKPKMKIKR